MSEADRPYHVSIERVTHWLVVTTTALIVLSVAGQFVRHYTGYDGVAIRLFYVDFERNVPTFFAVVLLLGASVLLGIITCSRRRASKPDWVPWAVLCAGFFVMALDEAAAVHERLVDPLRGLLGDGPYGVFYYAWVVPAIGLVVLLGVYFIPFLARLPRETRAQFLIAATLFVGGAVGIELAGGAFAEWRGTGNLGYALIVNVEEGLEMAGSVVFIHALLRFMAVHVRAVNVRFDPAPAAHESGHASDVGTFPARRFG